MTNYSKLIKRYAESTGKTYKEIFMEVCKKTHHSPEIVITTFEMLDTIGKDTGCEDEMRTLMERGLLMDIVNDAENQMSMHPAP